jgi:hypothetical protein
MREWKVRRTLREQCKISWEEAPSKAQNAVRIIHRVWMVGEVQFGHEDNSRIADRDLRHVVPFRSWE